MSQAGGPGGRRAPLSTYRVQLRPGWGFDQAAALAGYLADLGVSHLYSSPSLQAAPGSAHGYDVVDPTRPNAELGGLEGHRRLCLALSRAGLGQILDVVPNHMAITGPENAWWWDVLENGPSSVYASYFDVDWDPPEAKLRNRVLLPILGDHYGRMVDAGELRLARRGGSFVVTYADRAMPVAPPSLQELVVRASAAVRRAVPGAGGPEGPECSSVADELESIGAALGHLPPSWATDRDSVRARHRDKEVLRGRLAELCDSEEKVAAALDAQVAGVNADPEALDVLLERQNYRLAYWRTAGQELDYRRFFDIDSLVGVRVEDATVFEDSHALILSWLADGSVDGLRIDHIDGLADPEGYLRRLQAASGGTWVVVEKILEPGERLRETWPVAGTSGYDFAALAAGLFLDPAGEAPLTALWEELSGGRETFEQVAHRAKHAVMASALATDLARVTALFVQVCEGHRHYRDYTRADLSDVAEETIAGLGVYRTYVGRLGPAHPDDRAWVTAALDAARARRGDIDPDLFGLLKGVLLAEAPFTGPTEAELRLRFQQLTAPVMAKGVEDTALYTYNRLVAQNDVGFDPGRWTTPVACFHAACAATQEAWPATMVTTSTHDTKRSEDVRARLAVLSEIPGAWAGAVRGWRAAHRALSTHDLPDPATEHLLYQTLAGAWPIDVDRTLAYMAKATREAKVHTSWTDPDPAYDDALEGFVRGVLGDEGFVAELSAFVAAHLVEQGWIVSLAQTLLKLTAPGVPDVYQGCELWDLSLVDPDNRRPVDFELRRRLLGELGSLSPEACWEGAAGGLPKLLVTHRGLVLRRDHPEWLGPAGDYRPLPVGGERSGHLVAFARGGGAVTVVPRLVHGLWRAGAGRAEPRSRDKWMVWAPAARAPGASIAGVPGFVAQALRGTTVELPLGRWADVLTGEEVDGGRLDAGELLARFPVALLARQG